MTIVSIIPAYLSNQLRRIGDGLAELGAFPLFRLAAVVSGALSLIAALITIHLYVSDNFGISGGGKSIDRDIYSLKATQVSLSQDAENDSIYAVACDFNKTSEVSDSDDRAFHAKIMGMRDFVAQSCKSGITSILQFHNETVVDRVNLAEIIEEQRFQINSGLVDPASAVEIGKITGANKIVLASIDLFINIGLYEGYGIVTYPLRGTISINLTINNVETSQSKVFSTERVFSHAFLSISEGMLNEMVRDEFRELLLSVRQSQDFERIIKN